MQAAEVKQGDLIIGDFVHAHGRQMSKTALTIAGTTINETDALATNAQPGPKARKKMAALILFLRLLWRSRR